MSPHFMEQPKNNVVVAPDQWHAAPAKPPADAVANAAAGQPRADI
jgi:hypothetical protein